MKVMSSGQVRGGKSLKRFTKGCNKAAATFPGFPRVEGASPAHLADPGDLHKWTRVI